MSALKTENHPNEGVRLRDEHEQRSLLNHADATIFQAVVKSMPRRRLRFVSRVIFVLLYHIRLAKVRKSKCG